MLSQGANGGTQGAGGGRGGGQASKGTSKACFKCGTAGHWSRDCTVPRENWIPQQPMQNSAGTQNQSQFPRDPEAPETGEAAATAVKKRSNKRAKLMPSALAGPSGLAHVFAAFPEAFKSGFRGAGHEAGDLQRLLALYRTWHRKLLPSASFEEFIEALETLGSKREMQACMRELRNKELYGIGHGVRTCGDGSEEMAPPEDGDEAAPGAGAGQAGAAGPGGPPLEGPDEDPDFDLMAQEAGMGDFGYEEDEDADALAAFNEIND